MRLDHLLSKVSPDTTVDAGSRTIQTLQTTQKGHDLFLVVVVKPLGPRQFRISKKKWDIGTDPTTIN